MSAQPETPLSDSEYTSLYRFDSLSCDHAFHRIEAAGFDVVVQTFTPPHVRRQIYLLHGFTDHVGSHRKMIEFLLKQGFKVVIHDHPGHGLTNGPRGEIDDFTTYAQVAHIVFQSFGQHEVPNYLMAHSMGGAVALELLKTHPEYEFDAVLLLAPLVRITEFTKKRLFYRLLSPLKSQVARSFSVNSNDPVFMRFLHGFDPLQLKTIPTAWLRAYFQWYDRSKRMPPLDYRFAVVTGTSDITVNSQATHQFFGDWPNVSLLSLSGARHHLPGEADLYQQKIQHFFRTYFPS